ncbi:MAG: hypothetical protein HC802_21055, partial [Caldilineaceae bacterium]|nr:hypothetical protein [Caldilineaceae bacterium]
MTDDGLWIADQITDRVALVEIEDAGDYGVTKFIRDIPSESSNTSGMAVGGGYVWMIANAPPQGVFQVDMNSKLISHRQIPLGAPGGDGGGSHGGLWHEGKTLALIVAAARKSA